jgi:DNA-directed RNA polymerase subunit RPC12/RpoP
MSEFKYACPVCGQHIKCDSAQAGTVMDCPTCFQKITVPQAPANADPKFILTGSKFVKRKIPDLLTRAVAGSAAPPEKNFPVVIFMVLLLLAGVAGAAFFVTQRSGSLRPLSLKAWQSGDIGDASPAGSAQPVKRVFTITGSGADIWHQTDAFHFVFQPLNGDGALATEILEVQNTHEWAKAGVMIRESTNANAAFALASIRADGQAQFVWRKTTQTEAASSALAGGAGYPKWVKITRSGNSYSAYFKANAADDWQRIGPAQTIGMTPNTQAGLVVCSHNAGTLCQAQFAGITFAAEQKKQPPPAAPQPVAPRANDANWKLNLNAATNFPAATAAGRVHGLDFICTKASLQGGMLTLQGNDSLSVAINFASALPEALAGKSLNVTTNADKAAKVTLRWKDAGGTAQKEYYEDGYALRLEFGELANNRLPGKIYLCTPDADKSYVLGAFNADARKPRPKPPQPPIN